MDPVSQSYKACDAEGHRNEPETRIGSMCIKRFDPENPCRGRVQEYWEPATPLPVPPTWRRLQRVVDWIDNVRHRLYG